MWGLHGAGQRKTGPHAQRVPGPGSVPADVLIAETGPVTERLRMREIDDDEGRRLVRIEFVLVKRIEAQFTALRYFTLDDTTTPATKSRPA